MFLVRSVEGRFLRATDVQDGQEYRLEATKAGALGSLREGDVLISRVAPWDDHWVLSGVQRAYEQVSEDFLTDLKRRLRYRPLRRPTDVNDPQIQRAFEIQGRHHQAWVSVFGREEVLCRDGLELGAVMNRFRRYWAEMVDPATGSAGAEGHRQRHGHPSEEKFPLPDDILGAKDVVAVFDGTHGLAFFVGYTEFHSAFAGDGPVTAKQAERVRDYLMAGSVDYWLFQRMRDQYPNRTEYVFKTVLADEEFRLDRDFDGILRKFKGEAMRRPPRPTVTVVDSEDDIELPAEVRR